jgi:hypothetical protein
MTLPNFIGIGVQKGGTSWLHKQLLNHPEVFVPETRKEIHFFDWYYDRGLNWYKKWFPENTNAYKAIGEITPSYIYDEYSLKRIKQTLPNERFIVILRHPVKRAFSHYQMTFQSSEGFQYRDFDHFMESHKHGFKRGLYAKQLKKWFLEFDQDKFLILFSEELSNTEENLQNTFDKLGDFLNIDSNLFDTDLAQSRVGKARTMPRFPIIFKIAQKIRQKLKDWDMDHIAYKLKTIGITREIFSSKKPLPELTSEQNDRWLKAYTEDIEELEKLLGRSFSNWT